jgi:hypothetical protein
MDSFSNFAMSVVLIALAAFLAAGAWHIATGGLCV